MKKVRLPVISRPGMIMSVPEVVIREMLRHKSEIIDSWESFWKHFNSCTKDCCELWCTLQFGVPQKRTHQQIHDFVLHVGQLPINWEEIESHANNCDDCSQLTDKLTEELMDEFGR